MRNISLNRLLIGGIVAGIICLIGDAVIHGELLADQWVAVMKTIGRQGVDVAHQDPGVFLVYELLKGLAAVALYAAIRPRFGPGPATASIAAIGVWLLVIVIPLLGLLPVGLFGRGFAVACAAYGIIPIIIATLVGAWLYRETGD